VGKKKKKEGEKDMRQRFVFDKFKDGKALLIEGENMQKSDLCGRGNLKRVGGGGKNRPWLRVPLDCSNRTGRQRFKEE